MAKTLLTWSVRLAVLTALASFLALPASAQVNTIDYIGYGWEIPMQPLKAAGDEFRFVGVSDYADSEFGVDLAVDELTLHVYGLTVASELDMGIATMVTYSGGYLDMYQDPAQNAEWGINPPNATAPATFEDGTLFFSGAFTSMVMMVKADGTGGTIEGSLDGLGGTMIDEGCSGCVYTWGGVFTPVSGAAVPEGYTMQIDGVLEIDAAVGSDSASWGQVKALFNN